MDGTRDILLRFLSDITAFSRGMQNAQDQSRALNRELLSINQIKIANPLGKIANQAMGYAAGQLLVQGFQRAIDGAKSGFNFDDIIQQNTLAFETMTKSASEANKMVNTLWDIAKNTPFEFPDLLETTKRLIAFKFGLKEIPGMLVTVGDAASGLGLGAEGLSRLSLALGQMSAKGKVTGDDMRQLSESGVNAWDYLAKATGKTTGEMMKLSEKGLIPAKEAINVILAGMQQDFGGMMQKQSKTFSGVMSTMRDSANEAFGTAVKPLFEDLTNNIIPAATEKLNKFTEGFKNGGLKGGLTAVLGEDAKGILTLLDELGAGASIAGKEISGLIGPVGNITKALLEWKPLIPTILGIVTAMTAMNAAQTVAPAILTLGKAVETLYMEIATGSTVMEGFGAAMGTIMGPAGWVILGIGAIVGLTTAIVSYNQQQEEMTKRTIDAGNSAIQAMQKNQELIDKYVKLKAEAHDSAEKTAELKSNTDQLTAAIPGATAVINDQTMALMKQKQALDDLNQAQRDSVEAGYLSASANIDKQKSQLQAAKDKEAFLRKVQDTNGDWKKMGYSNSWSYDFDYSKYVPNWKLAWESLDGGDANKKILSEAITDRQKIEEQFNSSKKMIDNWNKLNEKKPQTVAPWGNNGPPPESWIYGSKGDSNYRPPDLTPETDTGAAAAKALEEAMAKMQASSKAAKGEISEFISTMKQFFQEMNSARDSIASFGSEFDKMTYEHFGPEKIKSRLDRTLREIQKWRQELQDLENKGVDEYTMNQLRSLGMGGAGIVSGLDKMTPGDLQQTVDKMGLIRANAGAEAYTGTVYKVKHEIDGKIDMYGISSEGQLIAAKQLVTEELKNEKNTFSPDPYTMRKIK